MKIVLGTLKDKGEALAAFLEPRVGAKPELSGDSIEIEDSGMREGVRPRHVKTYIKRFLFMNGVRKNYRVFVNGTELMVQEIELGEEEEEEEKAKPEEAKKEEEPAEEEEEAPKEEPKEEPAPAEEPAKEEAEKKPKPKKATRKPRAAKKKDAEED